MKGTKIKQLANGSWQATAKIGSIFGSEVNGRCMGIGETKEKALEALEKDRRELSDAIWA